MRTAKAWGVLMGRLGYGAWVAQGGDWGAGVTHALAHLRPRGLVGAHVSWAFVVPPAHPTPEEQATYDAIARFTGDGFGYFHELMTRPQTIGYGLVESPAALATFIYEKFKAWTDTQGKPEDVLSMDRMLDDISLYWFTQTGASAARAGSTCPWPPACSRARSSPCRKPGPRRWPNLIYWNALDRGGHFAAFEHPDLFAEERKAIRPLH